MIFHGKNALPRAALTAALTMSLGLSQSVLAAEGSGEMEVNAGLTQALSVTCGTALNFGTTSIVEGSRGTATVVTLAAADGGVTSSGGEFALDTKDTATAGVCTITGSTVADTGSFNVKVSGVDALVGSSTGTAPSTALTDLTVNTFTTTNEGISSGSADISIGAKLNIPANLTSDNFGDYTETVTVEVDDVQ